MNKKILKVIAALILVMVFGWLGSLFFGRYLTPTLIGSRLFSKLSILDNDRKSTTIINKTEKVIVKEGDSINEIASSAVYSVVDIFSFSKSTNLSTKGLLENSNKYLDGRSGTGTILTNDGIVVTYKDNIIEKNADYKVVTFSGSTLEATLLGIDSFTNLAYLKVDGINLTTIPFANSNDINSGKKVIILGNLSGIQKVSLTDGILTTFEEGFNLSGTNISSSEKLEGVFRVNYLGDEKYAGGPVISYNGDLLAISAIMEIDNKDSFFQIPVDIVKDSMQRVVDGRVDQIAKLGIYYISITPFYKNLKDLSVDKGALVYSSSGKQGLAVVADTVAEKYGIKLGDIITAIDGNEINPSHPLSNFVSQYEKNDTATLNILRGDQELELNIEF